jgi:hypothetical protein
VVTTTGRVEAETPSEPLGVGDRLSRAGLDLGEGDSYRIESSITLDGGGDLNSGREQGSNEGDDGE